METTYLWRFENLSSFRWYRRKARRAIGPAAGCSAQYSGRPFRMRGALDQTRNVRELPNDKFQPRAGLGDFVHCETSNGRPVGCKCWFAENVPVLFFRPKI